MIGYSINFNRGNQYSFTRLKDSIYANELEGKQRKDAEKFIQHLYSNQELAQIPQHVRFNRRIVAVLIGLFTSYPLLFWQSGHEVKWRTFWGRNKQSFQSSIVLFLDWYRALERRDSCTVNFRKLLCTWRDRNSHQIYLVRVKIWSRYV